MCLKDLEGQTTDLSIEKWNKELFKDSGNHLIETQEVYQWTTLNVLEEEIPGVEILERGAVEIQE